LAAAKPTPRPRLTQLKRASASLGIPYTTTRDAGMRREFPLIRIGRALYAEWADLNSWIETRKERA
jgi:hypothetical protein